MKKRMKKIVAVLAAATLCLAMGLTAMASESQKDPDKEENIPDLEIAGEASADFQKLAGNNAEVLKIFEKFGITYNTATLLGSADINLKDTYTAEELKQGVTLDVSQLISGDVKTGDAVYAYHQKHDGGEEIIRCNVVGDAQVQMTVYSASPFAFYKLDGAKSITNGANKSPKTGEF